MKNVSGATNGFEFLKIVQHNPDHLCYSVVIQTGTQSTLKQVYQKHWHKFPGKWSTQKHFTGCYALLWFSLDIESLNPEQQIDFAACISQHRLMSLITSSHMLSTYLLAAGRGQLAKQKI